MAIASLAVSAASVWIASSALTQARLSVQEQKLANAQGQIDWAQRKWFDLYFKVDQAYTALEWYQADYEHANRAVPSPQQLQALNRVTSKFREVITMMSVFPVNPVVDELGAAMNLSTPDLALSKERLKALADALESLRQKALVDKRVLNILAA